MSQTAANTASLPAVVIVGRPNVGKSTLFNAILGQRKSITGDEPGITRDRIYGDVVYKHKRFVLIDTGGIVPDDAALIPSEILKQARVALEQAAQIVLIVDGRTEMTSADRDLAQLLRKLGKPVVVAVNKVDSPKQASLLAEFYSLGFQQVMAISAEHRIGLQDLLDHVTADFPVDKIEEEEDGEGAKGPRTVRVAIIGRPNVGKSTLLNAMVGRERAIVSPVAGTTRDSVDEKVTVGGRDYVFVDTAGIRRKGKTYEMAEKLSIVMARKNIAKAHVSLLVIDATEGPVASDATIGGYAHEEGRALIICVNKWDLLDPKKQKQFEQDIRDQFKFLEYAPIVFLAAKEGRGVRGLFKQIAQVYENFDKRVPTGDLNRFAATLDFGYQRRIYYITQPTVRPPTFVLFMDTYEPLHFSAERMVANRIREQFGYAGTPVVIKTRGRRKSKRDE
jgi:GTP-binding protein